MPFLNWISLKYVSLTCDVTLNDFTWNIPNELFKRTRKRHILRRAGTISLSLLTPNLAKASLLSNPIRLLSSITKPDDVVDGALNNTDSLNVHLCVVTAALPLFASGFLKKCKRCVCSDLSHLKTNTFEQLGYLFIYHNHNFVTDERVL